MESEWGQSVARGGALKYATVVPKHPPGHPPDIPDTETGAWGSWLNFGSHEPRACATSCALRPWACALRFSHQLVSGVSVRLVSPVTILQPPATRQQATVAALQGKSP